MRYIDQNKNKSDKDLQGQKKRVLWSFKELDDVSDSMNKQGWEIEKVSYIKT